MALQGEPVAHNDLVAGSDTTLHSHAGGGGGFTPTYFQSVKSGDTGASTSWTNIPSWSTPSHTHADYSFNTSTGILTINTVGDYELVGSVLVQGGSSRVQSGVRGMLNGGAIAGCEYRNYSSRNTTQVLGSVNISGFLVTCSATDTLNLQCIYVGSSSTISAAGTWFQVRKIG